MGTASSASSHTRPRKGFARILIGALALSSVLGVLPVALPVTTVPAAAQEPPPPTPSEQYGAEVMADVPLVYYRLDELGGTTAVDASGHFQDATYQANVTLGDDGALPGTAATDVAATGADGGWDVVAPSATLPTGNAARSVELWVKTTAAEGWLAQYGNGWGLYLYGGNQIRVHRSWNCCSDYISASAPRPVNDGVWHHVVVTHDGGTITWYLDGAAFSRQGGSFGTSLASSLSLGAVAGTYDEIAVYGSALPADRVSAHWSRGASRRDPDCPAPTQPGAYPTSVLADTPLVYYRAGDEGSDPDASRVAVDSSGSCLHGSFAEVAAPAPGALVGDTDGGFTKADGGWGLTTSGANLPTGNAARTVELWVQTSAAEGWLAYYGNGWGLYLYGGSEIRLYRSWNCCSDYIAAGAPRRVNDGQWHHVALTFDGGTATWYLDGAAFSRQGTSFNTGLSTGFVAGAIPGAFDEIAVYGTALPAARLADHWAKGATARSTACGTAVPSTYGAEVLQDSPLAYYPLDELEGGDDRVAYDLGAGCQHAAVAVVDVPGDGAALTGDRGVQNPDAGWAFAASGENLPVGDTARTVELWLRTGATDGWLAYYGNGWGVYLSGGSTIRLYRSWNCCSDYVAASAPRPVNDGAWHHLAISYSPGTATWYLDGQAFSRQSTSFGTARSTGLVIGALPADIDEVAVFGTALSAERIAAHWSRGSSRRDPDCPAPVPDSPYAASVLADAPLAYYRVGDKGIDEDTRVATDSSGRCLHGAFAVAASPAPGAVAGDADGAFTKSDGGWGMSASAAGFPTGNATRSVELWVKSTAPEGWLAYYGNGWGLYLVGGRTIRLQRSSNCCGDYISADAPRPLNDGVWHHVVLTFDGGTATWYLDGAAFSRQGTSFSSALSTGLTVGALPGTFDEVAVYATALPPARVAAHWLLGASERRPACPAPVPDSPYAASVLADAPLAYYRAGDEAPAAGGSRAAVDSSGSCIHAAIADVASPTPGALTGDADGAIAKTDGGWALMASGASFPTGNAPRTVELWVNTTASDGWLAYYGNGWGLYLTGGSTIRMHRSWNCCSDYIAAAAPRAVNDGTWHHIALTFDGGTVTWYLDGAAFSRQGATLGTALSTGFAAGAIPGSLDEVAIYGTALSAARLADHWAKGRSERAPSCGTATSGHAQAILAAGPAAYYRAGDLAGATGDRVALDASPGCAHGAHAVAATAATGALAGDPDAAVHNPGSGWVLSASGANLPGGNNARSIELWVRTGATDGWLAYYGNGFGLYLTGGNVLRLHRSWNCCSDYIAVTAPRALNDGQWHHVAITYSPGTATWYLDGASFASRGTNLSTALSTGLTVGTLPGDYDEIAVYPRALSAAEVAAHHDLAAKHDTSITLSAPTTWPPDQPVTFTAQVVPSAGFNGTPSGTVTFADGTTTLGTAPVQADGSASFDATLAPGLHSITATYSGDTELVGSTSPPLEGTVEGVEPVTVSLTADPAATTFGDPVTLTATVHGTAAGGATPTGFVTFRDDDGTVLGTAAIDAGAAVLVTTALHAGDHLVSARYGGDLVFRSGAATASVTVSRAPPTVSATVAPSPSAAGQQVRIDVTVATPTGPAVPSGSVTVLVDGAPIGSATLDGAGHASVTSDQLGLGDHAVAASYDGDADFEPAASTPVTHTVVQSTTLTRLSVSPRTVAEGSTVTMRASVSAAAGTLPTGTVTFLDDDVEIASVALDATGSAELVTTSLARGSHPIRARYDGDLDRLPSTSGTAVVTVRRASTAALSADPTATAFGQPTTLRLTVSPTDPGAPTPTGSATFYRGSTAIGSAVLAAGTATFTTSSLPVGTHQITATYSGDLEFGPASSAAVEVVVVKAQTATALTSTPNPAGENAPITVTATVSAVAPGGGTPAGSVTFLLDGVEQATVALNGSGVATWAMPGQLEGSYELVATYAGSGSHEPSTSAPRTQLVAGVTETALDATPTPSVLGDVVTLTATVTHAPVEGVAEPTGTVLFRDGAVELGSAPVAAGGTATLSVSTFAVGGHTLTATYSGDSGWGQSTSVALAHDVVRVGTTTSIMSTPEPSVHGQAVLLTATVVPDRSDQGVLGGFVTFRDGTTVLGTGSVDATGAAQISTSLAAGTRSLTASYGGDAAYAPSVSAARPHEVARTASAVVLTSAPNPSATGQPVAFEVRVDAVAPGGGTATGTVHLMEGTTELAQGPLTGGRATFTIATLPAGDHTLHAAYDGDAGFEPAESSSLLHDVGHATTTALTSQPAPSVSGEAVTLSAVVTSGAVGTPTGTVTFRDGTRELGAVALAADGTAQLTVSDLLPGDRALTATYSGDADFATSQGSVTHHVAQGTTTVTVASSVNPSLRDHAVTFTATVSVVAPAVATPTGFVTFYSGTTALGTAAVASDRTARITLRGLDAGTHQITATYGGSDELVGSTSDPLTQVVDKVAPVSTLQSDQNPVRSGRTLTVKAGFRGPFGGLPVATVELLDGDAVIASAPLDGEGIATFLVDDLAVGTHALTARFPGDSNYLPATTSTLSQVVRASVPSYTDLAVSPNPAAFREPVTLSATVARAGDTTSTPTGFVTFVRNGVTLGTSAVGGGGTASLTLTTIPPGTAPIQARYGGDTVFGPSASVGVDVTVSAERFLTLVTPEPAVEAGLLSGDVTVRISDASGPVPAPVGGFALALTASSPTARFRSSDDQPLTSITIPEGASEASFRFRDVTAGLPVVTVDPGVSSGSAPLRFRATVTPGPLHHLELAPRVVTSAPGAATPFTAEGFDQYNNSVGDRTASATFAIAPDGSCTGASCSVATTGAHTVTATVDAAVGAATLIGDHLPVITVTPDDPDGQAPHAVRFAITATDDDPGDALTWSIDFGDGSPLLDGGAVPASGTLTVEHTYVDECRACVVSVTVDDGVAQPAAYQTARVTIASPAPLRADAGDPVATVTDKSVAFNGTRSTPAPPGIETYSWNFGDGTTAVGPTAEHTFTQPGLYPVSLTVSARGLSSTDTVPVRVQLPPGPGLTTHLTAQGVPLTGATVLVHDALGQAHPAQEIGGGEYVVPSLEDGEHTVYAFKSGFTPATKTATVSSGSGEVSIDLVAGQVAVADLTTRRLTLEEAVELGVDPNAAGNQNTFQFSLNLSFNEEQVSVAGVASAASFHHVAVGGHVCGCTSHVVVQGNTFTAIAYPAPDRLLWIIIPGQAKWLKEFFEAKLQVTNLAPESFTLTEGQATLQLPHGLSLADVRGEPQQLSKAFPDVPGGQSRDTTWILRGDVEGFYGLEADYTGVLDPVGEVVRLHAATDEENTIHVWGGSALNLEFEVDDHAWEAAPYRVRVKVRNVADVPAYNPVVTMLPAPEDINRDYVFQPRQQFDMGTARIEPGQVFETGDFLVVPRFDGVLNLEDSFVLQTGGNQFVAHTITTRSAPDPRPTMPAFSATLRSDGIALSWGAVDGALGYQVFTTPDYMVNFPFAPVATAPAGATSVVLPYRSEGYGLVALSTLVPGPDGRSRNHLSHVLLDLGARVAAPEDPCSAFGWSPFGSTVGNFTTSSTDLQVAVPGPALRQSRTYNSLSANVGWFGLGWSSDYEMRTSGDSSGNVVVQHPDGRCEMFVRSLDDYARLDSVSGRDATMLADGNGGFRMIEADRTTYAFSVEGRLETITDAAGRQQALSYDAAGHLDAVTDLASGRALHFTWTGSKVTEVATDPVTGTAGTTPLTWTYSYDGDHLVGACDPRGGCWSYEHGTPEAPSDKVTTIRKPKGNAEWVLSYDAEGLLAQKADGAGTTTRYEYPAPLPGGGREVRSIDAAGNVTVNEHDDRHRLVRSTVTVGGEPRVTTYGYDAQGHRTSVTDALNVTASVVYENGNLVSRTDGTGATTRLEYDGADLLKVERDPRSTSPTDLRFATQYDYNQFRQIVRITGPSTATVPSAVVERSYSQGQVTGETWAGTDPAVDGGTVPNSMLVEERDASGGVTTFRYDRFGDLREVTDPAGLLTTYTYDEIGRRRSETVHDPVHGAVTTTWTYDESGNVVSTTGPVTVDPVSGTTHQLRVTSTYDANSNTLSTTGTDLPAGTSRPSTFAYDAADRLVAATDPENGVTSRTYDARGLVSTVTDPEGRATRTAYDERGFPISETLLGFVDDPVGGTAPRDLVIARRTYDAVGRPVTLTDAEGRTFRTSYDAADRVTEVRLLGFHDTDGGTRDVVVSATPSYDAAGHPLIELEGGGTRQVTSTWDEAGRLTSRTLEMGAADRTELYGYLPGGEVASVRRSDPTSNDLRTFTYDTAGRLLTETVDDGAGGLTTRLEHDARGNLVRESDPRGTTLGVDPAAFTTEYGYDAAGRAVRMTSPPVALDGTATLARPETLIGWNAFDDQIARRDPRGNVTQTTYDGLSRVTRIDHPAYTTPAGTALTPTELFAYDRVGNLVSSTDRRGQTTEYTFDALNRVVRQLDPAVTGAPARGTVRVTYDDVGNLLSATNQIGAVEEWVYDDLDRAVEHAAVVRQPSGDPTRPVTSTRYDDGGRPTSVIDPTGATTTFTYNGAGEVLTQTDALGQVTQLGYDHAGRLVRATDPLGRPTQWTYDHAGRLVAEEHLSSAGALLTRATASYDAAGNLVTLTSPRGLAEADSALHTTTRTVDALGRLTAVSEPATSTTTLLTTFGYDLSGNLTSAVDGRGIETRYTYQSWDLPESTIEPSTTAHPALADRTFTTAYDAGGLPVREDRPGVSITRTFDELGRLTAESGAGSGVASASRSLGWDLAGRMTSVSHPSGALALTWDDRDLLTGVTGAAGAASFTYDLAGRMTQRTDPAGVASFTWTPRGELDTASDPLTGQTRDLTWDAAGQLTSVAHSAGTSEHLAYDDLGRLTSEELRSAAGSTLASHTYGYDVDGNLTSQADALPGNSTAGANAYAYDAAGRLTSWTAPGGAITAYGYDAAGNRTQIGAQSLTYDQRNRLLTGPEGSITWTARGTIASITSGSTVRTLTHDAFDRLVSERSHTPGSLGQLGEDLGLNPPYGPTIVTTSYAFDGLDRVATRNGTAFTYGGLELDPVNDGTAVYGRGAAGELVSTRVGSAASLVGTDSHGDVTHLWQPTSGGTVTGTRTFDPLGRRVTTTGTNPAAGFQGDYTDPATGRVWMGARWYSPRSGVFAERDTWSGQLDTPISLNRYTYAYSNPRSWFDPDGHSPESDFWCGGFQFGPFFPGDGSGGPGEGFDPFEWIGQMADDLSSGNFGDFANTFLDGAGRGMSAMADLGRQIASQAYRTFTNVVRNIDFTNIHDVLDVVGFIPGVGALADGLNAIIYAAEGDWFNAGLSGLGMFVDAATLPRATRQLGNLGMDGLNFARRHFDDLGSRVGRGLSGLADNAARGTRRVRHAASDLAGRVGRRGDNAGDALRGADNVRGARHGVDFANHGDEISDGSRMVDQPFAPAPAPQATRWRVGDDVYAATPRGEPSWTTVRTRHWRNQAGMPDAADVYGPENVARMQRGLAPQRYNAAKGGMESMELSHEPIPFRDGGRAFVERWPCEHALVDPFRKPGYC